MIVLLILYAAIAASFTLAKGVLEYSPPILFVAIRMIAAGTLLISYHVCRYKAWPRIAKGDWFLFAATSCIHIYSAFVFDLIALQNMSSFKAAFLYCLSPFLAALFSYHHFAETLTRKKLLGLCIGFVGFLPEIIVQTSSESAGLIIGFLSFSEICMLISVVSSVYGWILVRMLMHKDYSPVVINGYAMIIGGLLAGLTSAFLESWFPFPITNVYMFIWLTSAIIVVSNILVYNLYGHLLKKYTATFLTFAGMITPLFAVLFGWLFFDEQASWTFYLSIFVVIIGLRIFYAEELKQNRLVRAELRERALR